MKKNYLFYLLISLLFSIPLIFLRYISFPVLETQLFFGVVLFIIVLYRVLSRDYDKPLFSRWQLIPASYFLLIIIPDIISGYSLYRIFSSLLYFSVFLYFCFFFAVKDSHTGRTEKIFTGTVYVSGIIIIFLLLQFFYGVITGSDNPFEWNGLRNFSSEYVFALLIINIFCLVISNKKLLRIVSCINTGFLTFMLFYLRTRTGWAAFAVFLVFGTILLYRHRADIDGFKLKLILVLAMFVIGIFLGAYFKISDTDRQSILETAASTFDDNFHTNKARMEYWSASLSMISDNPITGTGGGRWAGMYPYYKGSEFTDGNVFYNAAINPHNDYIETASEYGIIVFLIYVSFIITAGIRLFRKSMSGINYAVYFLLFVSLSVCSLFSFTKDNPAAMNFFFASAGIAFSENAGKNSEEGAENRTGRGLQGRLLAVVLLSFFIFISIINYLRINYESDYFMAMRYKAQKNYNGSLNILNDIPGILYPIDPNKMPLDYYKGACYYELKEYGKALECFRKARYYAPYYPSILSNEASAYYMSGDRENAYKNWNLISEKFPNYIEPQINLLSALTNEKNYYEGRKLLYKINNSQKDTTKIKNYNVFLSIREFYDAEDM